MRNDECEPELLKCVSSRWGMMNVNQS